MASPPLVTSRPDSLAVSDSGVTSNRRATPAARTISWSCTAHTSAS